MSSLLRDAALPLYQQIADQIRQKIQSGVWLEHYKLKSEGELAVEFGVSRGTLRQALIKLVDEGLLRQVQGKGTFVTAPATDFPLAQRLVTMHEVLAESGREFTTELLQQERAAGPERVRSMLDVEAHEELLCLRRRLTVEGEPFVLLDNYVRLALCPRLTGFDFAVRPLFDALERECGITIAWGQRNFSATLAGSLAELLGASAADPVLYLSQVTYLEDGRPLEYSDVWVRGEKLQIPVLLQRTGGSPPS